MRLTIQVPHSKTGHLAELVNGYEIDPRFSTQWSNWIIVAEYQKCSCVTNPVPVQKIDKDHINALWTACNSFYFNSLVAIWNYRMFHVQRHWSNCETDPASSTVESYQKLPVICSVENSHLYSNQIAIIVHILYKQKTAKRTVNWFEPRYKCVNSFSDGRKNPTLICDMLLCDKSNCFMFDGFTEPVWHKFSATHP